MKNKLDLDINEDPEVQIDYEAISETINKYKINKQNLNILLGIGGSGPTKRIPAKTFINVIERIVKVKECKFFLATGKNADEQKILNEILESKFKDLCVRLERLVGLISSSAGLYPTFILVSLQRESE